MADMKDVEIGVITSAVGLKGEVKVKSYAEDPSRFKKVKNIALKLKNKVTDQKIESARISGGMAVIKLEGVNDRDSAELLRSAEIFMDSDDLEPLPEGQHYIRDLIGLTVKDAESGETLGKVKDVLTDRPQDLYVVTGTCGHEFMIPSVPEFIRDINEDEGVIRVKLIEGMIGEQK